MKNPSDQKWIWKASQAYFNHARVKSIRGNICSDFCGSSYRLVRALLYTNRNKLFLITRCRSLSDYDDWWRLGACTKKCLPSSTPSWSWSSVYFVISSHQQSGSRCLVHKNRNDSGQPGLCNFHESDMSIPNFWINRFVCICVYVYISD